MRDAICSGMALVAGEMATGFRTKEVITVSLGQTIGKGLVSCGYTEIHITDGLPNLSNVDSCVVVCSEHVITLMYGFTH